MDSGTMPFEDLRSVEPLKGRVIRTPWLRHATSRLGPSTARICFGSCFCCYPSPTSSRKWSFDWVSPPVQNLLYDLSQTTIPFDPVDAEDLAKPRKWEALGIARFMLFLGPISSVFDLATFALLWWIFGAYSPQKQSLFQSGWFVEGLLSQTLIVHMIRTRHVPFFQSWPCTPLVSTTIAIVIIGAILPFTAIGSAIGLVPLPIS